MPISKEIAIKNKELPDEPGVYFYYDAQGNLLYIGKATSLKKRVSSYFNKAHNQRMAELVARIARIDYIQTQTVIEALVLEANQIKAKQPKYTILLKDDKTFLYLVITNDPFPKPLLMRGLEIERLGVNPFDRELSEKAKKQFLAVFGPYTSGSSLRKALELVRKIIPYSTCEPPEVSGGRRPCFDAQIKRCPGVCTGVITKTAYKKIIKKLILFFQGRKDVLLTQLRHEMTHAARQEMFEQAEKIRRQIFALEHIKDVALITKQDVELPFEQPQDFVIDLQGRVEAYDISNISGTSAVGSMVVFEKGKPAKKNYRKFKIKTVKGSDDVAMMEEVLRRRLRRAQIHPRAWPLPEVFVIDGGKPQVNRVQRVLREFDVHVPVVGIAKGVDRKQDRLIFDRADKELARAAAAGKETFQKARDEAHRFAVKCHRELRSKASGVKRKKR